MMNKNQTSRSDDEKVTNEKPVSLFPLDFKGALNALLKVKPKQKEEKAKVKKEEKPSD
jgi:hypothetical protein